MAREINGQVRRRVHLAAWNLALAKHARSETPPGLTGEEHAEAIESEAIEQANSMAFHGGMHWPEAANRIAESLERLVNDIQEAGKP